MKCTRQIIHLIPCDAAFRSILKIRAQVLGVFNRLLQLIPNLTLLARGLCSAQDNRTKNSTSPKDLCAAARRTRARCATHKGSLRDGQGLAARPLGVKKGLGEHHLVHKSLEALVHNVKRIAQRRKHVLFQFGCTVPSTCSDTHESVSPRRSLRRTLRSDSCVFSPGSPDVVPKRDRASRST